MKQRTFFVLAQVALEQSSSGVHLSHAKSAIYETLMTNHAGVGFSLEPAIKKLGQFKASLNRISEELKSLHGTVGAADSRQYFQSQALGETGQKLDEREILPVGIWVQTLTLYREAGPGIVMNGLGLLIDKIYGDTEALIKKLKLCQEHATEMKLPEAIENNEESFLLELAKLEKSWSEFNVRFTAAKLIWMEAYHVHKGQGSILATHKMPASAA